MFQHAMSSKKPGRSQHVMLYNKYKVFRQCAEVFIENLQEENSPSDEDLNDLKADTKSNLDYLKQQLANDYKIAKEQSEKVSSLANDWHENKQRELKLQTQLLTATKNSDYTEAQTALVKVTKILDRLQYVGKIEETFADVKYLIQLVLHHSTDDVEMVAEVLGGNPNRTVNYPFNESEVGKLIMSNINARMCLPLSDMLTKYCKPNIKRLFQAEGWRESLQTLRTNPPPAPINFVKFSGNFTALRTKAMQPILNVTDDTTERYLALLRMVHLNYCDLIDDQKHITLRTTPTDDSYEQLNFNINNVPLSEPVQEEDIVVQLQNLLRRIQKKLGINANPKIYEKADTAGAVDQNVELALRLQKVEWDNDNAVARETREVLMIMVNNILQDEYKFKGEKDAVHEYFTKSKLPAAAAQDITRRALELMEFNVLVRLNGVLGKPEEEEQKKQKAAVKAQLEEHPVVHRLVHALDVGDVLLDRRSQGVTRGKGITPDIRTCWEFLAVPMFLAIQEDENNQIVQNCLDKWVFNKHTNSTLYTPRVQTYLWAGNLWNVWDLPVKNSTTNACPRYSLEFTTVSTMFNLNMIAKYALANTENFTYAFSPTTSRYLSKYFVESVREEVPSGEEEVESVTERFAKLNWLKCTDTNQNSPLMFQHPVQHVTWPIQRHFDNTIVLYFNH